MSSGCRRCRKKKKRFKRNYIKCLRNISGTQLAHPSHIFPKARENYGILGKKGNQYYYVYRLIATEKILFIFSAFFQFTKEKKSRLRSYVEKKEKKQRSRGEIQLNFRVRRLTLSKYCFFLCRVSSPMTNLRPTLIVPYTHTHTLMKTHCLSMLLSNSDRGAGGALIRFPLDEVERRRRSAGAVFRRRRLPPVTADGRRRRR